jgi:DNA-binding FadR family transcriptional regulator
MSSIDPVSSLGSAYQSSSTNTNQQVKSDFKSLFDALKSGDMTAAQTAFASLQKDAPNLFPSTTSQTSSATQTTPLSDLAAALNKGDLTAAQTAMTALQKGHHGHHHHRASSTNTDSATAAAANATSTDGTTGTVLNVKI